MDKIFNLDSKFMRMMNKFADIMFVNILTLICCIPIITIGPALTAMHYVILKLYRNEDGRLTKSFFKSFKENFLQSLLLGVIYLIILIVLFIDLVYIRNVENVKLIFEVVTIVAIVLSAFSFVWVFPLQCRYENKIRTTIKNSFMVGALHFTKSIMMILISFLPIVALMTFQSAVPVVALLGLAMPAYIQAMLYSRVFDKLEGVERTADGEIIDDTWKVELEEDVMDCPAENDILAVLEAKKAAAAEADMSENVQNDGKNQD